MLDPDEDPADKVLVKIWIEPLDDQGNLVRAEIEAEGYDWSLKYDYEIPTAIDASGRLSKELLEGLLTRDLIRDISRELQVKYEQKVP